MLECYQTNCCQGTPYSRSSECNSRQTITSRPKIEHRIDTEHKGLPTSEVNMGISQGKHCCHLGKHPTSPIYISAPTTQNWGSGRSVYELGQMYAFPPFPQIQKILKKLRNSYMAKKCWHKFCRLSHSFHTCSKCWQLCRDPYHSDRPYHRPRSRMGEDSQRCRLFTKAAEYDTAPRQMSKGRTYQSQWKIFTNWTVERSHDPFYPNL